MGQQQLLLLVLSTVIVGLATVAGIQAFSENQAQAAQDAIVQRGLDIATDIQAATSKPTQLGGIDTTSAEASDVANAIGLSGTTVDAEGAGANAECAVTVDSQTPTVTCESDEANQGVIITVHPDQVQTDIGDHSIGGGGGGDKEG